jgi:hypothetical protein
MFLGSANFLGNGRYQSCTFIPCCKINHWQAGSTIGYNGNHMKPPPIPKLQMYEQEAHTDHVGMVVQHTCSSLLGLHSHDVTFYCRNSTASSTIEQFPWILQKSLQTAMCHRSSALTKRQQFSSGC